ncbi:hypothetical protein BJV82DRAFT_672736 [Fennellomyces sp. T-0311]|nr:hypothetical protein BJV82DRAFT_672736 [Fennellomyces sp. T-0311]
MVTSTFRRAAAVLALMVLATDAHITFTQDETLPGVELNTSLAVGHGCDGSNTIEISVSVPEEVTQLEPQEIAGWNLTLQYRNGSSEQRAISNFTWSGGNLGAETYQDFGVIIHVPSVDVSQNNVTLYFPTIQRCENGTNEWVGEGEQSEAAGQKPAPELIITSTPSNSSNDHSGHGGSENDDNGAQQLFGLSAAVLATALGAAVQFLM